MRLFRCSRCLYPSTKPDLHFTDGLCSACIAFDKRADIDWTHRCEQFLELVKANPGKSHDVIVAVSGGKDSTAQVVRCIELGLRPLAVCATTDHLSLLGRKNLDNIANLCDLVEVTPHKPTRRNISKWALENLGDISWCEHHLIWSVPVREALAREIPIVLYGECPQNEYGAGPSGSEKQTQLTQSWVHEFGGLLGFRLSDVADILDIEPKHLELYRRPDTDKVQAVFMGAYFPWDGFENYKIAERNGFTPYHADVEGSLFGFENIDNVQTGAHDHLRWLKFGYSRACDIASNHIRRGYMDRDVAADLVMAREGKFPKTYLGVPIEDMLAPLGMTLDEFNKVCDRFTNREVVSWASSPESFRFCCGMNTALSKESASVKTAA